MKVFLSHSSVDKALARRLAGDLQAAGVRVWLDQWEIKVGEEFVGPIERGIEDADFVVVLLTPAGVASDWVSREWRMMVLEETRHKRVAVLPVRAENCQIPDFLAQRGHADISGGSYPLGLAHLLATIRYHGEGAWEASDDLVKTVADGDPDLPMLPVVTPISLEVSFDLIPLCEPDGAGASRFMDELVPRLRADFEAELGFRLPGIRVRGNETDMPPGSALVLIDEIPETMKTGIDAIAEPAEFLCQMLSKDIRRMARHFLDIDTVARLVESVSAGAGSGAVSKPEALSWCALTEVLALLLDEGIGIGDMPRILEALSRDDMGANGPLELAERVRHALQGQITVMLTRGRDSLPVVTLDPEIESRFQAGFRTTTAGVYLDLDPQFTNDLLAAIRRKRIPSDALLITASGIRPYLRRLVKLEFPGLRVISHEDLAAGTEIREIGRIRFSQKDGKEEKQ